MSSSKKYIMLGTTAILLPLGKLLLKKVMRKFTEKSERDNRVKKSDRFDPVQQM
ncbi:MAG TPA: hypothetical protein HPP58_00720 [Deltaproteobacteria bacterium]|nr:hypothetical protein [Deltaproteobacteria bacterium]